MNEAKLDAICDVLKRADASSPDVRLFEDYLEKAKKENDTKAVETYTMLLKQAKVKEKEQKKLDKQREEERKRAQGDRPLMGFAASGKTFISKPYK